MKFAHDFRERLEREGFPAPWVDSAVPYGQLKKILKKIQNELAALGLDADTLQAHLNSPPGSTLGLTYNVDDSTSQSSRPKPKLMAWIQVSPDGSLADVGLSPSTKALLEKTVLKAAAGGSSTQSPAPTNFGGSAVPELALAHGPEHREVNASGVASRYKTVEIPLVFDDKFFSLLHHDTSSLEAVQDAVHRELSKEVKMLGDEVSRLSKPNRFAKSDLVRWRTIFELYVESQVFFSTGERDRGSARSSVTALKRLQQFQRQVEEQLSRKGFKLAGSRSALARFFAVNQGLLKHLQFQELNQTAIIKIMKKFNKRTSLGAPTSLPPATRRDGPLVAGIAKDVCAELADNLLSTVPRLDDYLCPVCLSIAYRAIRMSCSHVLCTRCVVKMQRRGERNCPLCRADVVMKSSPENLDFVLESYLRRYFRRETRQKRMADEVERGIEVHGPGYKPPGCKVM